jgi:hypothetical protein
MKPKTNGLEPFSVEEEQRIIRDCVKAANNTDTLTDKVYRFLKHSTGFIAYYNRFGFIRCYREPGTLKQDILDFQFRFWAAGYTGR